MSTLAQPSLSSEVPSAPLESSRLTTTNTECVGTPSTRSSTILSLSTNEKSSLKTQSSPVVTQSLTSKLEDQSKDVPIFLIPIAVFTSVLIAVLLLYIFFPRKSINCDEYKNMVPNEQGDRCVCNDSFAEVEVSAAKKSNWSTGFICVNEEFCQKALDEKADQLLRNRTSLRLYYNQIVDLIIDHVWDTSSDLEKNWRIYRKIILFFDAFKRARSMCNISTSECNEQIELFIRERIKWNTGYLRKHCDFVLLSMSYRCVTSDSYCRFFKDYYKIEVRLALTAMVYACESGYFDDVRSTKEELKEFYKKMTNSTEAIQAPYIFYMFMDLYLLSPLWETMKRELIKLTEMKVNLIWTETERKHFEEYCASSTLPDNWQIQMSLIPEHESPGNVIAFYTSVVNVMQACMNNTEQFAPPYQIRIEKNLITLPSWLLGQRCLEDPICKECRDSLMAIVVYPLEVMKKKTPACVQDVSSFLCGFQAGLTYCTADCRFDDYMSLRVWANSNAVGLNALNATPSSLPVECTIEGY